MVLQGAHLGQEEALREEHDLTDLLQVWDNHHHGSEQSLHTLGQLCTAGIARVHGDEDADTIIQCYLNTLKLQCNGYSNTSVSADLLICTHTYILIILKQCVHIFTYIREFLLGSHKPDVQCTYSIVMTSQKWP